MDKIIVTALGIASIAGIYWFFFGKKEEHMEPKNSWDILVEGGYNPSTIFIPSGKPSTITFTRKDPSSCLEEVVLPDFKIKKFLPLNESVTITVSPAKPGAYSMHCGMNMFHGRIVVT